MLSLINNVQKLRVRLGSQNTSKFYFPTIGFTQLENKMSTVLSSKENIFQGRVDRFNGVVVHSENEICDSNSFNEKLQFSLQAWTEQSKRGIWFKVGLQQVDWVPILAKNGFNYHHAQNDYVMMYKWLPQDEECNIPPYAHTMIGVGAVVVNDKDEVLVVSEKYNKNPHWKLPGGYVEPGENLVDAAIREVFEETNIHTEFLNMTSFRHSHGGQFNCSDLYVVISLKPLSLDIKMCEREISACAWLKISEYVKHPDIHELNRFFIQKYIENKRDGIKIDCRHGVHQILGKPYTVYHAIANEVGNKL